MRTKTALGVTISLCVFALGAGADDWPDRLKSLGLRSAYVVIEYALTDDCSLASVTVRNASSSQMFDAAAIDRIVSSSIGPFDIANNDLIATHDATVRKPPLLSMTKRAVSWRSALGHTHIECLFAADGAFRSATLVGASKAPAPTVQPRPVMVRLSTLGTMTMKFSFNLDEQ